MSVQKVPFAVAIPGSEIPGVRHEIPKLKDPEPSNWPTGSGTLTPRTNLYGEPQGMRDDLGGSTAYSISRAPTKLGHEGVPYWYENMWSWIKWNSSYLVLGGVALFAANSLINGL